MIKLTEKEEFIGRIYFNSNMTMQQIADKANRTRQYMSLLVIAYIKKKNIKFYTKHVYICSVCGAEVEKIIEDKCVARKDIDRIEYHKKGFTCKDCIENNLVKCCRCKVVGFRDNFIKNNGRSFKCSKCNNEEVLMWVSNNREKWNKYQREWVRNNNERYKTLQKKYRIKNRDKINKRCIINAHKRYINDPDFRAYTKERLILFYGMRYGRNLNKDYW